MKTTFRVIICLVFFLVRHAVMGQTNTIDQINNILGKCTTEVCFTSKTINPEGSLICCFNRRSIKFNESKTELIFTQKHINSKDNKLLQTFITKIKIKDIDFDRITILNESDNERSVNIKTLLDKKTFLISCNGPACTDAVSYGNNMGFNIGPDCVSDNLDNKLLELFKKLRDGK